MEEHFGFIREKLDIKILILFVLRRLPESVTLEKLSELVLVDEGITYFDFAECVQELVSTEHVSSDGHRYAITEKGQRNGEITENSLPFSVRVKAEKQASEVRQEINRKAMISVSHTILRKGGYSVELSLSDGISDVISMNLFAVNQTQAQALEAGFTKKAEDVYNAVVKMLLDA